MRNFNYFYNNIPITKENFEPKVPVNWEYEIEHGEYSWGYYRAVERDHIYEEDES